MFRIFFSLKTVLMTKSVLVYSCGEVVDVKVFTVVCSDAEFLFPLSEEHAVIDKSKHPAIIIDKIRFFILDVPFFVFHYRISHAVHNSNPPGLY